MVFAIYWHESVTGVHVFPIPNLCPHPIPLGCPSAPALSALFHALNLDWWSISHMVIYMFQCYSLKSSHSHLLPQSPKVCSLYLCLFCYLAYRVVVTIFLNSIYMHQYTVLVFSFSLTSLCIKRHSLKGLCHGTEGETLAILMWKRHSIHMWCGKLH